MHQRVAFGSVSGNAESSKFTLLPCDYHSKWFAAHCSCWDNFRWFLINNCTIVPTFFSIFFIYILEKHTIYQAFRLFFFIFYIAIIIREMEIFHFNQCYIVFMNFLIQIQWTLRLKKIYYWISNFVEAWHAFELLLKMLFL